MGRTSIEWTDETWNPVRGCAIVSKGCTNCYAMRQAHRSNHSGGAYQGLTMMTKAGPVWNGRIRTVPELVREPFTWRRPRRVFVNSMSDLFHEDVPEDFIRAVWCTMADNPRHVFQILTKRPQRMRDWLLKGLKISEDFVAPPLRNVWLGVSVEDQAAADERIPLLLETPAAVRWISAEPLLGPIDLRDPPNDMGEPRFSYLERVDGEGPRIDWAVIGGESGPGARPMHPAWARSLRDQCAAANVPFFFKQQGAYTYSVPAAHDGDPDVWVCTDGRVGNEEQALAGGSWQGMFRVGKKAAGRLLDHQLHDEYPA